jgi:hypothetical protein
LDEGLGVAGLDKLGVAASEKGRELVGVDVMLGD